MYRWTLGAHVYVIYWISVFSWMFVGLSESIEVIYIPDQLYFLLEATRNTCTFLYQIFNTDT